jgi:hypothetical protein
VSSEFHGDCEDGVNGLDSLAWCCSGVCCV